MAAPRFLLVAVVLGIARVAIMTTMAYVQTRFASGAVADPSLSHTCRR